MIKKIAWDTFKNTGDVNTFLEFKQIKDLEEKEIENGEGIDADIVFRELRQKYGY